LWCGHETAEITDIEGAGRIREYGALAIVDIAIFDDENGFYECEWMGLLVWGLSRRFG